jgi:hypothetical protein
MAPSLKNFSYDDAFRIAGITDAGGSTLSWSWINLINYPQDQRAMRALERLLEWMRKNPFDDSYCSPHDSDRLEKYFEEVRRMHRIFQCERIPGR